MTQTLEQLSAAATQGEWKNDPGFQSRSYLRASGGELVASFSHIYGTTLLPAQINCSFIVTLDNIRKWNADWHSDDELARNIARYYIATNLHGVVGLLLAELAELQQTNAEQATIILDYDQQLAEARDKALDEAAEIA